MDEEIINKQKFSFTEFFTKNKYKVLSLIILLLISLAAVIFIDEFKKRKLPLKNIYFADNYDEDYYSMRKPGVGMFQKASEEFNINLENCLMIGDSIVDIQVGNRLKMKTIFLLTGMGNDYLDDVKSTCDVDLVSNNLLEAAKDIKLILQ